MSETIRPEEIGFIKLDKKSTQPREAQEDSVGWQKKLFEEL